MLSTINVELLSRLASSVGPRVLDGAAKGVVVLALAGVASLLMRRASAAARHALWYGALMSLLLLPVLSLALPNWRVIPEWKGITRTSGPGEFQRPPVKPIPLATPSRNSQQRTQVAMGGGNSYSSRPGPLPTSSVNLPSVARSTASMTGPAKTQAAGGDEPVAVTSRQADARPVRQPPAQSREHPLPASVAPTWGELSKGIALRVWRMDWALWLSIVWVLGVVVCLMLPVMGAIALRRLERRSARVRSGPWISILGDAIAEMGVWDEVTLLRSARCAMPMTWGVRRPRIILPDDALKWPAERLRVVLLHELAHIGRRDCQAMWMTRLACAAHWFNPLAWWALAKVQNERERACDDLVLGCGSRASSYAEHLLHVAARIGRFSPRAAAALAVARTTKLEGRLRAILDGRRNRRGLTQTATITLAVGLGCVIAFLALLAVKTPSPKPKLMPVLNAPSIKPEAKTTAAQPRTLSRLAANGNAAGRALNFKVVDKATKAPIGGLNIKVRIGSDEMTDTLDAEGALVIPLPEEDPDYFNLSVRAPGYVPMHVTWRKKQTGAIPKEYMLEVEKGSTVGGIIKDESGQPIAGATVSVLAPSGNRPETVERVNISDQKLKTDAQGRWKFDLFPPSAEQIWLKLSHPEYVSDSMYNATTPPPMPDLRKLAGVMVMKKGLEVAGTVSDSDGNPVPGATVSQGEDRFGTDYPKTKTDARGRFRFGNSKAGSMVLTVLARGFSPQVKAINVGEKTAVEFKLEKGRRLRGKLVDVDGNPVAGARIVADTWGKYRSVDWSTTSRDDGTFEWTGAPADEVEYHILKQGYQSLRDARLTAGPTEHVVTMRRPQAVRGTVVDAETGETVPQFKVVRGTIWQPDQPPSYSRWETLSGKDGKFEVMYTEPAGSGAQQALLRIEAAGYLPALTPKFKADSGDQTFDVKLKKGSGPTGTIVGADGKPVSGAQVTLLSGRENIWFQNGRMQNQNERPVVTTGADGKFTFMPEEGIFLIAAVHDSGFAQMDEKQYQPNMELKLSPWARLEGTFKVGSKPGAEEKLSLSFTQTHDGKRPQVYYQYEATTDAAGRFVFDRLTAGTAHISRLVPRPHPNGTEDGYSVYTSVAKVEIKGGQSQSIEIGGKGRPVVGKLEIPKDIPSAASTFIDAQLTMKQATPNYPANWVEYTAEQRQKWWEEYSKTEEGKKQQEHRHYAVVVHPDGRFQIDDVESGNYLLHVGIYERKQRYRSGDEVQHATLLKDVNVELPKGPTDEPMELGSLEMTRIRFKKPGDPVPPFEFDIVGGKASKLEDYRGRHVLLVFWEASWATSQPEFAMLNAIHEKLAKDERFAMIGFAGDEQLEHVERLVGKGLVKWPHAHIGSPWKKGISHEFGIRFLPSIWLIGPDGKVVARDLRGEQVKQRIEQALGMQIELPADAAGPARTPAGAN